MAKLFKIQAYIVDYNDDFKKISQLQHYLNCVIRDGLIEHTHIAEADIGEWHDDHPLNIVDCPEAEYEKYFKEN